MFITKMETVAGYQLNLDDGIYIYFDDIHNWGTNIMFRHKGSPSGGMWPPQSVEFLKLWGEL